MFKICFEVIPNLLFTLVRQNLEDGSDVVVEVGVGVGRSEPRKSLGFFLLFLVEKVRFRFRLPLLELSCRVAELFGVVVRVVVVGQVGLGFLSQGSIPERAAAGKRTNLLRQRLSIVHNTVDHELRFFLG